MSTNSRSRSYWPLCALAVVGINYLFWVSSWNSTGFVWKIKDIKNHVPVDATLDDLPVNGPIVWERVFILQGSYRIYGRFNSTASFFKWFFGGSEEEAAENANIFFGGEVPKGALDERNIQVGYNSHGKGYEFNVNPDGTFVLDVVDARWASNLGKPPPKRR